MSKKFKSSYWLDDEFMDKVEGKDPSKDPVKLAAYRKAIGNFVRIVTGDSISVNFSNGEDSFTDGKTVTIAAKMKESEFDSSVGLALHEGSHIKLTDFSVLKTMDSFIQAHDEVVIKLAQKHGYVQSYDATWPDRWAVTEYVLPLLKDLHNIIEDRRIDNFIYRTAPGYRGYYEALYAKYFNSGIINIALQSTEYRTEDWDSYMFRVINITNTNRDLKALKGLERVWEIMDLANIDRLKSTADALNVAWDIFLAIEEHVPAIQCNNQSDDHDQTDKQFNSNHNGSGRAGKTPDGDAPDDDGGKADGSELINEIDIDSDVNGDQAPEDAAGADQGSELTDRQRQQLAKAIENQKNFTNGEIRKTRASKSLLAEVRAVQEANVETREVKFNRTNRFSDAAASHDVLVIRKFNMDLIRNINSGMYYREHHMTEPCVLKAAACVADGIRLGTMLGKKLKVRMEERDTKFNRLRSGKIDKRMIANAGFGSESIFEKIETFAYRPGMIHISIDNSGSMGGNKFEKSLKTAAAIAKACDMIDNMDCVISFRAGAYFGKLARPVVLIAYDSRQHDMHHLRKMLPMVSTAGSTPEGLCFDAIMKDVIADSCGKDAYFINFSDGEPYYSDYYGVDAYRHTKAQVDKMKREGIKVISYFISHRTDDQSAREYEAFNTMYGKDASFINVDQINDVARTMNDKFLQVI